MLYSTRNSKSFVDVCHNAFGRKVLTTNATEINSDNVVTELSKVLSTHWHNRAEIDYLDKYYRGDQPILYRYKKVRPEINNKIVENHAFEIVEFMTAQNSGEPIQYVRRGTDESKSEDIKTLNDYMNSEDKDDCDTEIMRWKSICGTAYRFVYMDLKNNEFDEAPFGIECLDPRDCGVVYSTGDGKKPLLVFLCRKNEENKQYFIVYTTKQRFEVMGGKIIDTSVNGMGYLPIIEYPNNSRRLSDIEIAITVLDGINKVASDRLNGIEQFIQAFMLFKNCEIDRDTFIELIEAGGLSIKDSADGMKSDAKLMTAELSQEGTQVTKDDLYENMLIIEGMPSRQQNTGGDTGQAVYLRNGWDFAEQRAEIKEPIFFKSERAFLKLILSILRTKNRLDLKISDIEIKITRSKMDNMSVKVNALNLLLAAGIDEQVAIKTISLWSDPEEVYLKSRDKMGALFEQKIAKETTTDNNEQVE